MTESPAARLLRLLGAKGRRWPGPVEHFPVIGSTNDRLRARAREGAPEWSVVLADRQTAGRGRRGRHWVSPPGNLHLSVLLRPTLAPQRVTLVPLVAGLAVAEAMADLGATAARVKWPNDVLVGSRKLAGVLAEASSGPSGLEAVVVGLGVNVSAEAGSMPPGVRPRATSLTAETGVAFDLASVAAAVLGQVRVWYHALYREGPTRLLAAWRSRSVPWWGRLVEVRSGAATVCGLAHDVDEEGALRLEGEDGALIRVLAGEARELRLAVPLDTF